MIAVMTMEKARLVWAKNPNRVIAFAPGTHQDSDKYLPSEGRWLIADGSGVLGTAHSREDCDDLRNTLMRKRG